MNNSGPKIESLVAHHIQFPVLNWNNHWFRFVAFDCSNKKKSKLVDEREILYEYRFAIKSLWSIQSSAFDKSVREAPNLSPLSIASLNFSIITRRHFWALCPFRKQNWFGKGFYQSSYRVDYTIIFRILWRCLIVCLLVGNSPWRIYLFSYVPG